MTSYKLHLTDTIERMKKGQNIHGKLRPDSRKRSSPMLGKSSIRKSVVSINIFYLNSIYSSKHNKVQYTLIIIFKIGRQALSLITMYIIFWHNELSLHGILIISHIYNCPLYYLLYRSLILPDVMYFFLEFKIFY